MITIHFENGILTKITPGNARINDADFLISDKEKYDLHDVESIKKIKTPNYKNGCGNVTLQLEYCLKKCMASSSDDIFIALAEKYIELMNSSPFDYPEKEYYILPRKLYDLGRFQEGDAVVQKMRTIYPAKFSRQEASKRQLIQAISESVETYNNDLIEYVSDYIQCDKCSAYKGRVYSAYGGSKKFPQLPADIMSNGACEICGGYFLPYLYYRRSKLRIFLDSGHQKEVDAVKHSKRPFVDGRTPIAKARFEEWRCKNNAIPEAKKLSHYRDFCLAKINHSKDTPKSFSAYMRKINATNSNEV